MELGILEQIDYANEKGIDFIICDHHTPSDKIPNAIAVFKSKNRKISNYPYKDFQGLWRGL